MQLIVHKPVTLTHLHKAYKSLFFVTFLFLCHLSLNVDKTSADMCLYKPVNVHCYLSSFVKNNV